MTQASLWRALKPHVGKLIENIVFPLMKHTEEDEELWNDDPKEYIREKYDIFEEMYSPASASAALLGSIVKRKTMLGSTVDFTMQVLNMPSATAIDVDAALHMIGEIAKSLMKNNKYAHELERMLMSLVVPRIQANERLLRARVSEHTLSSFC